MLSLTRIGRLLAQVEELGEVRTRPAPGDLAGDFDGWFDGGAFKDDTGSRTYFLLDGTTIGVTPFSLLPVRITFPEGAVVTVMQRKPVEGELVPSLPSGAFALCAGCGEIIPEGSTHEIVDGVAYHLGCASTS